MAENERMKAIADRLAEDYTTESGQPAQRDHVADVVDAAAEPLGDAPIQDFVPLLVENAARDRLHAEGLHVVPAEPDSGPARRSDGERLVSGYAQADLEQQTDE
jgi:hypothetical protein